MKRRERVQLECSDEFVAALVADIRRAKESTGLLRANLARLDATWEPHDWSEWA